MDELSALIGDYYSEEEEEEGRSKEVELRTEQVGEAVWDPRVGFDDKAAGCGAPRPVAAVAVPVMEVWRAETLRKAQALMEEECLGKLGEEACRRLELFSAATLRNGNGTFERWLLSAINASKTPGLVPDAAGIAAAAVGLAADLERQCGGDEAQRARAKLASENFTKRCAKAMALRMAPDPQARKNRTARVVIAVGAAKAGKGAAVTITFRNAKHHVTHNHYLKLQELFRRAGPEQRAGNADFAQHLFCLLHRYEALGGDGFQAAISGPTFDALREHFGVELECFASPLNARFAAFCSAFPDVDAAFGSRGSFLEWQPLRGSFQANPPFVDSVVEAMQAHMERLLRRSEELEEALSFVVVVPSKYRQVVQAVGAPFCVALDTVENRAHVYLQGSQHKAKHKRRKVASTCDTDVHVLQTSAAQKRWPATEDARRAVVASFAPNTEKQGRPG